MKKLRVDCTGTFYYVGKIGLIKLFNKQTHIGKYVWKLHEEAMKIVY